MLTKNTPLTLWLDGLRPPPPGVKRDMIIWVKDPDTYVEMVVNYNVVEIIFGESGGLLEIEDIVVFHASMLSDGQLRPMRFVILTNEKRQKYLQELQAAELQYNQRHKR